MCVCPLAYADFHKPFPALPSPALPGQPPAPTWCGTPTSGSPSAQMSRWWWRCGSRRRGSCWAGRWCPRRCSSAVCRPGRKMIKRVLRRLKEFSGILGNKICTLKKMPRHLSHSRRGHWICWMGKIAVGRAFSMIFVGFFLPFEGSDRICPDKFRESSISVRAHPILLAFCIDAQYVFYSSYPVCKMYDYPEHKAKCLISLFFWSLGFFHLEIRVRESMWILVEFPENVASHFSTQNFPGLLKHRAQNLPQHF